VLKLGGSRSVDADRIHRKHPIPVRGPMEIALRAVAACAKLDELPAPNWRTVRQVGHVLRSDTATQVEGFSMRAILIVAIVACSLAADAASAQGLVWNLPPDGTWVRYEGVYRQVLRRPESAEGDLTLQWQRNLDIRSVGQEVAAHDIDHDGREATEPCRWLEFKLVTGKVVEGIIDAGPGATVLYKVLVPESEINGAIADDEGIFRAYLPVVKGFRKLGDEPAQPLEAGVLQIYPNLSLLRHYRDLVTDGTEQTVDVKNVGTVTVKVIRGHLEMETGTTRSVNDGEVSRSPDMPFGLVRWTAKTVAEQKNLTDPRSAFAEVVELSEELTAVDTGANAESELLTE
jgi:hypothetical protein